MPGGRGTRFERVRFRRAHIAARWRMICGRPVTRESGAPIGARGGGQFAEQERHAIDLFRWFSAIRRTSVA